MRPILTAILTTTIFLASSSALAQAGAGRIAKPPAPANTAEQKTPNMIDDPWVKTGIQAAALVGAAGIAGAAGATLIVLGTTTLAYNTFVSQKFDPTDWTLWVIVVGVLITAAVPAAAVLFAGTLTGAPWPRVVFTAVLPAAGFLVFTGLGAVTGFNIGAALAPGPIDLSNPNTNNLLYGVVGAAIGAGLSAGVGSVLSAGLGFGGGLLFDLPGSDAEQGSE